MERQWQINPHDAELIEQLESTARVSPIIAQLLASRGIVKPEAIHKFLTSSMGDLHDPGLLPNIDAAAQVIFDFAKAKKKIFIFGDYDCDGMSGTAILVKGLKLLQAEVSYFIPNRLEDGYGLSTNAIQDLAKRDCELIVTVDCGVANIEEVDLANKLGMSVVITDHHEMRDRLPNAAAVVHPSITDSLYPFHGLCGAGVAFKLIWAIFRRESGGKKVLPHLREFLVEALGLASIGTVADVVPLTDENRIIVRHGLTSLKASKQVGIQSLLKVSKLAEKPTLASDDIGFSLGPRLNAAGRLGQAQLGVELLTTQSFERAEALSEYIDSLNASRVSLERSVYLAANKQIKDDFDAENDAAFVLDGTGWHAGVIGIIAGRIAEKYHKPTIIISWDKLGIKPGMGSGRTAGGLRLNEAFIACTEHLLSHGGHAAAAGLKIEHSKLDMFRADFVEYCSSEMTVDQKLPTIQIDAEVILSQLTLPMMEQLNRMAPFGQANPRPKFCAINVEMVGDAQTMGGGDRHLTVTLKQSGKTIRAVAFGKGEWVKEMSAVDGPIDIVFNPVINEFRGLKKVEIHLVDWRKSKQLAATA